MKVGGKVQLIMFGCDTPVVTLYVESTVEPEGAFLCGKLMPKVGFTQKVMWQ